MHGVRRTQYWAGTYSPLPRFKSCLLQSALSPAVHDLFEQVDSWEMRGRSYGCLGP